MRAHLTAARLAFIILLTMLAYPMIAAADIKTGQDLIQMLNAAREKDRIEAKIFIGNILFDWEGKSHCKPPQATVGQAVAITQKFLNENPKIWHYEAAAIVGAALGDAWPCPQKKESK